MKLKVPKVLKDFYRAAKKHSPEILTGLGVAGMITGTVMAVRATPKALQLMEEEKARQNVDKLTPVQTVKAAWKPYVPAVAVETASVLCLIGASSVNLRRNAALTAAYSLMESSSREFQEKVVETVGEKKTEEIRDAVAKSQIEKNPLGNQEITYTKYGDTLCYESLTGRYFKSDIEHVRKALNVLNADIQRVCYASLNDFFYLLDLPECDLGNDLGWNVNNGLVSLRFSAQLSESEVPCLVLDYATPPVYGYRD